MSEELEAAKVRVCVELNRVKSYGAFSAVIRKDDLRLFMQAMEDADKEATASMAEIGRLTERLDEAYDMILNYLQDIDKGQNLSDNAGALWRLRSAFEEVFGV